MESLKVPVTICQFNGREALAISLIENLQREDSNVLEKTEGVLTLLSLRLRIEQPDYFRLLYRMRYKAHERVGQNVLSSSSGHATQPSSTLWG